MTDEEIEKLKGCIRYWEGKLLYMKAYLQPGDEALIELTIKFLKELK